MEENKKVVKAFAPASVANVGPGFDFMGFAMSGAGDIVTVSFSKSGNGSFRVSGKYADAIPDDPEKNTAGVAIQAFLDAYNPGSEKFDVVLEKNLPLGSGLGSSASSAAAAVFALNHLLGNPYETQGLIQFAMEGERIACGTAHADNAAPSLLGGFIVIRRHNPLDVIKIKCPDDLFCTVIHPHIVVKTSDARRILRREIPMADVTAQCANVAFLVAGLTTGDFDLIGRSMEDILAEPRRIQLIPGFREVKAAAIENGALGCNISGSGPSLFALCKGKETAIRVAAAMQQSLSEAGLDSDNYISGLNSPGAVIV